MIFLFRLLRRAWWWVPLGACIFLLWINASRWARVGYLSGLAETEKPASEVSSPTGYAGGVRQLVLPDHNNDGYQWIAQTQVMLARREWRLHHVDYDNAPFGRAVHSPSPYRWWMALVAECDHALSGRPVGLSVERTAILANPLLHVLLLLSASLFAARRFGPFAALLLSTGLAGLFPFATAFLSPAPDDHALVLALACWSLLPLLGGAGRTGRAAQRDFFFAGMVAAAGLWVCVAAEIPILAGIALGGVMASVIARTSAKNRTAFEEAGLAEEPQRLPWRAWAWGGSAATLIAYLLEFFPSAMEFRLDAVHPLYAAAWLGLGELLERMTEWIQCGKREWSRRDLIRLGVAGLAIVAVPLGILLQNRHGLELRLSLPLANRLSGLPSTADAEDMRSWISREGVTGLFLATLLPLLVIAPLAGLFLRRRSVTSRWIPAALALGPVLATFGMACFQLRWWGLLDGALLGLVVACAAVARGTGMPTHLRALGVAAMIVVIAPGLRLLAPVAKQSSSDLVSEKEIIGLIERDFSQWLARQTGGTAVVFAPPELTTSLIFHGGLRGLSTPYRENKDGFGAAVRIAGASSADEALALVQKRGITHIAIPSWDPFLDEYARLGSAQPDQALIALLHHWLPPRWLKPVPYVFPKINGFEGQSLVVFEVVDLQENAAALSRLAEYFIETEQIDLATSVSGTLQRSFVNDLGAKVACTQVELAKGNASSAATMVAGLLPLLTGEQEEALPWDRRVSLTLALARVERIDLARPQLQRCIKEIDESRIRSLTTVSLYRFLVLAKALGLDVSDPRLRELARGLLPVEFRERV